MAYALAADLVALVHLGFIAFVIFGAVLGLRSRGWRYAHCGAMAYGVAIEVFYWYCPLTYVEQRLREAAGEGTYSEPFIAHYLNKIIYLDVSQNTLILVASLVLVANSAIYYRRWRRAPAS